MISAWLDHVDAVGIFDGWPAHRAAAEALAQLIGPTGSGAPGIKAVAEGAGVSMHTASRTVRALELAKLISRDPYGLGSQRPHLLTLVLPPISVIQPGTARLIDQVESVA